MGALPDRQPSSRARFLAWEDRQRVRHEFVAGRVVAMTGGSRDHDEIVSNLHAALRPAARARGCRAYQHNCQLTPVGTDDVFYPDVLVSCVPYRGLDISVDSAAVICEVLSPSTRAHDWAAKFPIYRDIPELMTLVYVESRALRVRAELRQADGSWRAHSCTALTDSVPFAPFDVAMTLAEIYAGTDLLAAAAATG